MDIPKAPVSELTHFGVKGMKWGVRKESPPSDLSREQRRQANKNVGKIRSHVFNEKYVKGDSLKENYKKFSSKDLTLEKGQTIRRITSNPNEKFDPNQKTYVSYKTQDSNIYRALLPTGVRGGGLKKYKKDSYEATYKSLETLKSPSDKKRIDAFVDLIDKKAIKLSDGSTVSGREFLATSGFSKEVKTLNAQQLGLHTYHFLSESHMWNTPLSTAYFKSLKEQGYNAVLDDNDRGHLTSAPLILLNPNGSLKKMSVKKLSADDINKAQLKLDDKN